MEPKDNVLKAIDRNEDELIVENYMVLFGGRDIEFLKDEHGDVDGKIHPNVDGSLGDFFTENTIFDSPFTETGTLYVDWEHGKMPHESERNNVLGVVDFKNATRDETGIKVQRILNRRNHFIKEIIEPLVDAGVISNSVESLPEGMERAENGELRAFPLRRDTLTVTPTEPRMLFNNPLAMKAMGQLADEYPDIAALFKNWQDANGNQKALIPEAAGDAAADSATGTDADAAITESKKEQKNMTEQLDKKEVAGIVAEAIKAAFDKKEAAELSAKEWEDQIVKIGAEAVKEYQEELDKKATNDPGFSAPNLNLKTADVSHYDNYPAGDLAATLEIVNEAHKGQRDRNSKMVKALALRLESDEANDETERTGPGGRAIKTAGPLKVARSYLKSAGIKANETNFSTNAGYGDEWIGVGYSGQLWEQVRTAAQVADRVPSFEFPAGVESLVIPLESSDPIWYLVAQSGDPSDATAQIANTVPAKALGTAQKTMTLGKLGSSAIYTGEMTEDAMLPFVTQLRTQIGVSGGEVMDHVCIDGDTATGANTNVNDIASTPVGTEAFLVANGFRKSCLVTTTANSRDGGALSTTDFIETAKLMGAAGKVAFDKRLTSFIIDPMTHWKAIELADVKTKDVFANPTIENGQLMGIYGYEVIPSYFMHFASLVNTSYEYLTEATGKIDLNTAADNTKGAILAVRWDYWKLGFRRRITTEVVRFPRSDAWEITSLMRFGLTQRDTEASAISYNLTV